MQVTAASCIMLSMKTVPQRMLCRLFILPEKAVAAGSSPDEASPDIPAWAQYLPLHRSFKACATGNFVISEIQCPQPETANCR